MEGRNKAHELLTTQTMVFYVYLYTNTRIFTMPAKRLSIAKRKGGKKCPQHERKGGAPKASAAECGYPVGACKRGTNRRWYKIIAAGKSKRWQKCSDEENRKLNAMDRKRRERRASLKAKKEEKAKKKRESPKRKKKASPKRKKKVSLKKNKNSPKRGKKAPKRKSLSVKQIARNVKRALIRGGCGNGNLGGG